MTCKIRGGEVITLNHLAESIAFLIFHSKLLHIMVYIVSPDTSCSNIRNFIPSVHTYFVRVRSDSLIGPGNTGPLLADYNQSRDLNNEF